MQNIKISRIALLISSVILLPLLIFFSLSYYYTNSSVNNSKTSSIVAHSVIHNADKAPEEKTIELNADIADEAVNQQNATNTQISDQYIESIVAKYIAENPEKIIASLEGLDLRIKKESIDRINNKIKALKDQVEDIANFPVAGDPSAKKTIVMFYDYNCPYCQQANNVVNQFLATDKDLRVIYRPFPIMGELSDYLSKSVLTIHQIAPDKFKSIHDELMSKGEIKQEDLDALLIKYDINKVLFDNEFNNRAANLLIDTQKLAQAIELRAAPAFIINDKFYKGVIHPEILKKILNSPEIGDNTPTDSTNTPKDSENTTPPALQEVENSQ
ncbi:MAG: thioredoxin domain-containing protein [Rickettsiaceae bacterium]|nr:thioredoxin domain-containing protein [Rickettsiaceae bacterium]